MPGQQLYSRPNVYRSLAYTLLDLLSFSAPTWYVGTLVSQLETERHAGLVNEDPPGSKCIARALSLDSGVSE